MSVPTFIGAHWYNRPQTLGECAAQLVSFLQELQRHHPPAYGRWFEQANSKAKALAKPLPSDYAAVIKSFRPKASESSYPATSFSLALWNGALADAEGIVLRVALGSSEKELYPNYCLLEMYDNKECQAFYTSGYNVKALENLFSQFWQPEKLFLE